MERTSRVLSGLKLPIRNEYSLVFPGTDMVAYLTVCITDEPLEAVPGAWPVVLPLGDGATLLARLRT